MDGDNDNGNGGSNSLLVSLGGILVALVFLSTSVLPALVAVNDNSASLSQPIVPRQDSSASSSLAVTSANNPYRLSRSAIQEKFSGVPVFYLVDKTKGDIQTDIFLSYNDAVAASTQGDDGSGSSTTVKVTTLEQVLYPLVLKRGRMRMAAPPIEIQQAEGNLAESGKTYRLVPSTQAREDALKYRIELTNSDLPLFLADRLAFSAQGGGMQVRQGHGSVDGWWLYSVSYISHVLLTFHTVVYTFVLVFPCRSTSIVLASIVPRGKGLHHKLQPLTKRKIVFAGRTRHPNDFPHGRAIQYGEGNTGRTVTASLLCFGRRRQQSRRNVGTVAKTLCRIHLHCDPRMRIYIYVCVCTCVEESLLHCTST